MTVVKKPLIKTTASEQKLKIFVLQKVLFVTTISLCPEIMKEMEVFLRFNKSFYLNYALLIHSEPKVQLDRAAYSIHEPINKQKVNNVKIKVVRTGDLSDEVRVRCSTRDGSAHSGSDYNPKSGVLTFEPGEQR